MKKWLGYREARRRDRQPLAVAETDHVRSMVKRIAAMLLLEPTNLAYATIAGNAFAARDLGW